MLSEAELTAEVFKEYQRSIRMVGTAEPYDAVDNIGIHDVLKSHFLIADHFYREDNGIGGVGVKDAHLLHSALSRQNVGFQGERKWTTVFDVCATVLYGIIKNHPFHDANKRTAFLSAIHFLDKNNRILTIRHRKFEDFIVKIAEGSIKKFREVKSMIKSGESDAEIKYISSFLRNSTRQTDKRYYTITYRQLDQILRKFDCYLANPKHNSIDVIKVCKEKKFYRLHTDKIHRRVAQIGFPGMSKQVGQRAISTVRKATQLTPQFGVDSQNFFKGVEPEAGLIAYYEAALRRLSDR